MKIKTKLLLGFGLLFLVVVFFGIVSIYYIEDISEYSKTTVKNNYETLTFTSQMRGILDENDLPLSPSAVALFNNALKKQENNITEPGEKGATTGVRNAFGQVIDPGTGIGAKQQAVRTARAELKAIEGLNMKAIEQKNNYIHATVSKATFLLGGIVFITFLILFVFIINFPGFILNPLNQFIDGIHEIRQKNYDARLEFKTGDEFAALAIEFNAMAANLSDIENQNLTKIISGENQLKIVIEEMQAGVIGLNENQEILFINGEARGIFKTGGKQVTGLPVHDVVKGSFLKTILESKPDEDGIKFSTDTAQYQVKKFEIVVPNLKPKFDTLQFAGYTAGMIYILKNVEQTQRGAVNA